MKTATDFPATIIPVLLTLVVGACSRDVLTPAIPDPEPNRAPVSVGSIPAVTVEVDGARRVDVAAYFSDPDGDALSYAAASSDPSLARVSVAGTAVSVAGVANRTGSIPPEIGNLAALEILDLYGNNLTGSLPPEIGNLAALEVLNLYDNALSGSIPTELANLAALVHLDLSDNALSGSIPTEIGDLTTLLGLLLNDNAISGPIPPELAKLAALESLWLDDNDLSGPIPMELANLAALKWLRLDGNSSLCTPDDTRLLAWLAALNVQPPPRCGGRG